MPWIVTYWWLWFFLAIVLSAGQVYASFTEKGKKKADALGVAAGIIWLVAFVCFFMNIAPGD